MSLAEIEKKLTTLTTNLDEKNFIFDFLTTYNQPKATIQRIVKGDYNQSKKTNELIWKKKIYFYRTHDHEDVHDIIDEISKNTIIEKNKIRFLIVTNFTDFLAVDIKNKSTLDIKIKELSKNADFFLPLTGLEKNENIEESQADIKAAYKMGKLYDVLIKDNLNFAQNEKDRHGLNIFFSRLLFCFFSEDSGIFEKALFTKSISSHTLEDGSDLDLYLDKLFKTLNTNDRDGLPSYFKLFPFVNGGLFKNNYKIPKMSFSSRKLLIECGELDWISINPDIFGSMMQAVVQGNERKELGMHYTSVSNILKIIKPLFLDDLYESFHSAGNDKKKLNKILSKIYNIKIFDPACGSGNFLVVSFKELYRLEIEILEKLKEQDQNEWLMTQSGIKLTQFYGIEIEDYPHEMAKLSLWIAQHLMNIVYENTLGESRATLPLQESGNIICNNATNVNWSEFCKNEKNSEIFVIGNPPYIGPNKQTKDQKKDIKRIFNEMKGCNILDYITCWFSLGSKYISKNAAKLAFVSTNSIIQGEQVSILWPEIYNHDVEIYFAYKSFHWTNNAKNKAGVTCVIIGLDSKDRIKNRKIYDDKKIINVKYINAYLHDGPNVLVYKENTQIVNLPKMNKGNMPLDGGNLILSQDEKEDLINENTIFKKFIRPFMGAEEFINGKKRYCLWIKDEDLNEALTSKIISSRIEKVKNFRSNSKRQGTLKLASKPHRFSDLNEAKKNCIIIPRHTSERRKFLTVGYLDKNIIVPDSSQVIFDPPLYIFTILSCKLHCAWASFVGGTLGTSPRYSIKLCYNTFPIPSINEEHQKKLDDLGFELIEIREKFSNKTLADLYDPKSMPLELKKIHIKIDKYVDILFGINQNLELYQKIYILLNLYNKIKSNNKLL